MLHRRWQNRYTAEGAARWLSRSGREDLAVNAPYRCTTLVVGCGLLAALAVSPPAQAQVVQLPSYSFFATSSSMLVPDQGTGYLGGVSRSSSGGNLFGSPFLPPIRSYGSQTGAMGLTVSAQIHDFDAMDRALLGANGEAAPGGYPGPVRLGQRSGAPSGSVTEMAARKEALEAAEQSAAAGLFERARQARADGKPGVAKIYLQQALKRARGPLHEQIQAALAETSAAVPRVVQRDGNRSSAGATSRRPH